MPVLAWAPPGESDGGLDELGVVPGPETSEHRFGTCDVCRSQLMTNRDGDAIIAADPTTP